MDIHRSGEKNTRSPEQIGHIGGMRDGRRAGGGRERTGEKCIAQEKQ